MRNTPFEANAEAARREALLARQDEQFQQLYRLVEELGRQQQLHHRWSQDIQRELQEQRRFLDQFQPLLLEHQPQKPSCGSDCDTSAASNRRDRGLWWRLRRIMFKCLCCA